MTDIYEMTHKQLVDAFTEKVRVKAEMEKKEPEMRDITVCDVNNKAKTTFHSCGPYDFYLQFMQTVPTKELACEILCFCSEYEISDIDELVTAYVGSVCENLMH